MVTRAQLKYIRITPRKFRQIIPLVKGKNPEDAIAVLATVKKGAAKYAMDLLKAAVANAKRMQKVDIGNLYISKLIADCGPTLKRYRAASMGRASMIKKRTAHLTVELDEVKILEQREDKAIEKERALGKIGVKKAPRQEVGSDRPHHAKKPKGKNSPKTESGKKLKG